MHEDEITGKAYDARLMRRLMSYTSPYRRLMVIGVLLTLLASFLQLLGPYLTKLTIDKYIALKDFSGLYIILIVYFVVIVFVFLTQYAQIYVTQYFGQQLMFDIRSKLFKHIQSQSLVFFDKNPVGRLMTRVTSDVEALNQMFTQGIVSIFGDIFLLAGIIGALIYMEFYLALWVFAVIPVLFLISFLFRSRVRKAFRQIRKWVAQINSYVQENLTGMSIVQVFNRVDRNHDVFTNINQEHTKAHVRTVFYFALFYPAIELVGSIAIALVIWRGGIFKMEGLTSFGALVAFIQYTQMFFRPISDLSEKYNILQQAMASSERIFKLLDTPVKISSPEKGYSAEFIKGEITFKNIWFAYNDPQYVLKDISLQLNPGESVAIVGHTGAGKTSLINVLGRHYDLQKGDICIDDVSLKDWNLSSLRSQMAVVLQDVFLFSGSVTDNIRLGNDHISIDTVKWAAKQVNAHRFIENLPNTYDTPVKERGMLLSTGQKQLISFARALVTNPRILILDEATSSVDTETELLIQKALHTLMQNRTSLIIAHRLSTIKHVDKIVVMHKGSIREMGTHDELLAQKGLYYQLYLLQYKAQEAH
ncbi:MAG: ABC transporter ATP-binding protein [Calditrichales bacterium]|nr:MAG: ABC transporter ATP-binding protein [Calditrichales bacterium]